MKRLLLMLILVTSIATPVNAKESPEVILRSLPAQIKTFIAEDPLSYDDKRLGASIGYNDPGGIAMTVYLYDLGGGDVEDGVGSEMIKTSKEQAIEDIRQSESMGYYSGVKIISDNQTIFDLGEGKSLKVLFISLSYILNNPLISNQQQVASDLYLVGLKGYICKIRVSRPAVKEREQEGRIQEALATLLSVLHKR